MTVNLKCQIRYTGDKDNLEVTIGWRELDVICDAIKEYQEKYQEFDEATQNTSVGLSQKMDSFIPNYAATTPKRKFRMPVCQFLIDFPLFKAEFCFGKSHHTIRLLQNLLEPLFTMHFDNTSSVKTFQVSSKGMPLSAASQAPPGNGLPKEKPTLHEHTNALRGRRSVRPPSPTS